MRHLILFVLVSTLASCLYVDIKVPRGYRTATPAEVKAASDDPAVTGKSCMKSVLWLVSWGDASYAAAVKDALGTRDGILYDMRADIKVNAYVFGLYARNCTMVSGRIAKP